MWFNPAEITKIAKPPLATLATLATYLAKGNAECPKVAEVAKVATTHDAEVAPLHEPAIVPFEGTGTEHIEKKIIDAGAEGAHFLWAVESKDGGIFLAAFTPPSTLAEVLIDFPNAVTATPEKQRNGVWNAH